MSRKWWISGLVVVALMSAAMVTWSKAEVAGGSDAPAFTLTDTHGKTQSLADYKGKWVVLEWINDACPFVKKHYGSHNMQKLQETYTGKGVAWLSICSSAKGKQGNHTAEEWNKIIAGDGSKPTALLLDEDGKVGKAYGAKTTPHMFIISPEGKIVYQGAIDSKRSADSADIATSTNYVAQVLDAVLDGKPAPVSQTTPYGCNVKY
ncbi:MAG: thioredoxin family protein [Phycisphaeraceae bacterium]|nr:thioredoxin family protein [Phycisphaeraceae bacterium]